MDESTIYIQEEVLWYMLFVDDIVLVDESRDGVNASLRDDGMPSNTRAYKDNIWITTSVGMYKELKLP